MTHAAETMVAARARATVGIGRAASRAERATSDWVARAADVLRMGACMLHAQGPLWAEFTVEKIRTMSGNAVPAPPDERSWGAATRVAKNRGYIEPIPGKFDPAASSNGSPKQVYRKGPKA